MPRGDATPTDEVTVAGSVDVEVQVGCQEPVDSTRWAALLAAALRSEGVATGAQVGLTFAAPGAMAELNATHMGVDGPTDVLAFPIDGADAAGSDGPGPPGVVGDLVVCPSVAAANAPSHAGTTSDEIALLVVHGALHLVGLDHHEVEERRLMQGRERDLLAAHHRTPARDPWATAEGSSSP